MLLAKPIVVVATLGVVLATLAVALAALAVAWAWAMPFVVLALVAVELSWQC